MRPMQQKAYSERKAQYLLIKSPPASGKSRALMFITLDKLYHQGVAQAIIAVPQHAIGASFNNEALSKFGFWADWNIPEKWNLCRPSHSEHGRLASFKHFLKSDDKLLLCTHATFRFSVEQFGIEKFDNRLIAIDECHHASSHPDNKLGVQMSGFIARNKVHIIALTGSYFRGDGYSVLPPQDEMKFKTVTYSYYEQFSRYIYLKGIDIDYSFYQGCYLDNISTVLNSHEKTILHIPNIHSRESSKDKYKDVERIMDALGEWQGVDPKTGFQRIKTAQGHILKIADLVDDTPLKRNKVLSSLKDPKEKYNRDHVDIIIALGMAKEGFDWMWCDHALTIGYRASLTEIVQIIGRTVRDAKGKKRARFTNLIAEPNFEDRERTQAINDMFKAIASSLLMEQILTPRFIFTSKTKESVAKDNFDYGQSGYESEKTNIGFNEAHSIFHIEIKGLLHPQTVEARRICNDDLNDIIAGFIQEKSTLEAALFDKTTPPQELTLIQMRRVIREKYPDIDERDQEAIRQHAVVRLHLTQRINKKGEENPFLNELTIAKIDESNPFEAASFALSQSMSAKNFNKISAMIAVKREKMTDDDARELVKCALKFKEKTGKLPSSRSKNAWEAYMARGIAHFSRMKKASKPQ